MFIRRLLQQSLKLYQKWLLWGLAALCFGVFVEVFGELHEEDHDESDLNELDAFVTNIVFSLRSPPLSQIAVDITALGSTVVITSVVVFTACIFLMRKKLFDALQIAIAGACAGLFSQGFKLLVARDRPPLDSRLVDVQGFSYPSGHSLAAAAVYLTIGLIFFKRYHNGVERIFCLSSALVLIGAIGLTRVYLGVHYPSDVAGGISFGMGLAFLIFALRRMFESIMRGTGRVDLLRRRGARKDSAEA